jgi:anti-anti-sigma factor
MVTRRFDVRQDDDGIYHLQGELTIHDLDALGGFLEKSLKGGQQIAISLDKVKFVDTAALQLLIAYKKRFAPEARLRISAVSAEVEEILSLSGLKAALM